MIRKILLITGKIAEEYVREIASKFKNVDVYTVDVDVAALITPKNLEQIDLSKYDLVLLPGLARGQWSELEKKKKTKIRLGPIHAYDIELILKNLDKIRLSHQIPACKLIKKRSRKEEIEIISSYANPSFKIRDLEIGGDSRIKIISEIQNTPELSSDDLIEKIENLQNNGADIIDLSIPNYACSTDVKRVIKIALDNSKIPISVDTASPKFLLLASEMGVDLLLSITSLNIKVIDAIKNKNIALVLAEKNLEKLFSIINRAKRKFKKIIADCLLEPPPFGLSTSIKRYIEFRQKDANTPLLMGIGNVTELCDADSIGINAILTFIADEIGVNLILTTEASNKTIGSTKEIRTASYMARISKKRRTPPKDLSFNLLAIKEKRKIEIKRKKPKKIIKAKKSKKTKLDPKGCFLIWIENGKIFCARGNTAIVGTSAKEIIDTVISLKLISTLEHAAYLSRELTKAEIALKLNKNYIQDDDLNFGFLFPNL